MGREILDDDLLGLAAELSYRWLIALFPLMIIVGTISGLVAQGFSVGDPVNSLLDAVGGSLPRDAAEAIRPQLESVLYARDRAVLSLGLVLTAYAASSGMRALIKALNRAYDLTEVRPFWRQTMVALAMTVFLCISAVVAFIMLVGGQEIASSLAGSLGLGTLATDFFALSRYPLGIVALIAATAFLYRAAPARRLPWKRVMPGVILFIPGWLIVTAGFSFYSTEFASYDDTYGAISGIIVLLVWLYLAAFMLLLGGELNATLEQIRDGTIGPDGRRVQPAQHGPGHPHARPIDAAAAEAAGDATTEAEDQAAAEDREGQ
ncbi:MAG: YihY/virulence factor BrkB family protein [Chloroflexota bacterium]|nr:YihY/virulence factor BrkB family protein [Chloroflexota bacterium]